MLRSQRPHATLLPVAMAERALIPPPPWRCAADGVGAATDLQRYSQPQLEQLFGLKPTAAALLAQWCRGLDPTPVQVRRRL